ncbi:MAG: methyltransferase [Propionibacteriaceae bacterium]|nr:methyltransferase [Propionibacteriaceae bacterium]
MTLRELFTAVEYTAGGVLERIGEHGQAGLGRNVTVPALRALGDAHDPLATLIKLFILQQTVPSSDVEFMGRDADAYLLREGSETRAAVDVRPYGSPDDGASGWIVSDLTPGLNLATSRTRPDYVLGVSPASTTLAQLTMRTQVGAALDLGTGCGVQSLHLAQHADHVVATDVNRRALEMARQSAELTGVDIDFRDGSLFEPVAGERFDLIVSNPPYVMSPPAEEGATLTYRETNFSGDGLLQAILREAPAHLAPGGSLQLLTNWAILDGQGWDERIRAMVQPLHLDAWVVERERLDVYSYIEMWLADAGLAGSPEWMPAYTKWLEYFEQLGISEVGMGWILITDAGRATPHVRVESWPHAVQQPVGHVFARHRAAVDAATVSDDALLASKPRLADVRQETVGAPGAEDPEHIVFRQTTGLLRGMTADTGLAAVLGALDGDLTVGQVLAAVAQILELDTAEFVAEMIPKLRQALEEQYLVPEGY